MVETRNTSQRELRNAIHRDHCDQHFAKMRPNDATVSIFAKRARKKVIQEIGNKMLRGEKDVFIQSSLIYPWLTRHMINGYIRRKKLNEDKGTAVNTTINNVAFLSTNSNNITGRPKGTSAVSILDNESKKEEATNKIAINYQAARAANGGVLKRGTFKKIHDTVMADLQLNFTIKQKTIISRLNRNSLSVNKQNNKTTPLFQIESLLLQISLWKQDAGQPITPSEGIALANSLIDGKPIQEKLKTFQSSIRAAPTGSVSAKFWQQFIKRNKHLLDVGNGYRVAGNRTEWVTYENVDRMYDLVYEQMIRSGVAKQLEPHEYYYVNSKGDKVSKLESVGLQVKVEVIHPEYILFGDEVGTDISQKNDGHVGGQKFVAAKGTRANVKSSHRDGRLTVIGLTAANGDAVMAIIIFAAEELTFEQRMGHDIRVLFDDELTIDENSGPGKTFPGGPSCNFRGYRSPRSRNLQQ